MNRKLHNTASALMVPGTLLLLALAAYGYAGGAPVSGTANAPSAAAGTAELPTRPLSGRAGRVRHSVALPFFSFAPRG